MTQAELDQLRYPVGKFSRKPAIDDQERTQMISMIADLPRNLRNAVQGLSETQLDTPYREGGWCPRQIVHHVADSHMNAYVRMKLAKTEDKPRISPYKEALWAELADARTLPVEESLRLLESLHRRWVVFLTSLSPTEFSRPVVHPESGEMTIDALVQLYSWHSRHHTAHITKFRERMKW